MNFADIPVDQHPVKEPRDPARLATVGAMPCVICHEWGMEQLSRTMVHHCIHGRHGTSRAPDSMTIPLCDGHHQSNFDNSKIALHREPDKWRAEYGHDTDWLGWVEARIDHHADEFI